MRAFQRLAMHRTRRRGLFRPWLAPRPLAREMRDLAGTTLGAHFGRYEASAAANSETPQPSGSSTTA